MIDVSYSDSYIPQGVLGASEQIIQYFLNFQYGFMNLFSFHLPHWYRLASAGILVSMICIEKRIGSLLKGILDLRNENFDTNYENVQS